MSTKNPFFVSPPTDYQQFGSGTFNIYWAGSGIKISMDGGSTWQTLPTHIKIPVGSPHNKHFDTVNTNDKVYTVPDNEIWNIQYIRWTWTATSTVGNRVLNIQLKSPEAEVVFSHSMPSVISASGGADYKLMTNFGYKESETNGLWVPFPNVTITSGWVLRFRDSSDIDDNDDQEFDILHRYSESLEKTSIRIQATDLLISWTDSNTQGSEQQLEVLKIG
jgi:hypothetical protein